MLPPAALMEDNMKAAEANRDDSKIPYQLPQPTGMLADLFTAAALDLDRDGQDWIPQAENIFFKPLLLCATAITSISCASAARVFSRAIATRVRCTR